MCGIAGIINFKSENDLQSEIILKMTERIKHRGPDDEGYLLVKNNEAYIFSGDDTPILGNRSSVLPYYPKKHINEAHSFKSKIAFGHRRLSIQDLSVAGHQPMSYLNRYWILYNGEIYNFLEVKKELKSEGYSFISNSDTEVIMASYDRWGSDCLKKFNGMWAFVIHDINDNTIFVSRDRFGIKPLYYYKDEKLLVFISEIKTIIEHPEVRTSPNIKYCRDFIKKGNNESIKETAFNNIYRFAHSSYFKCNIDKLHNTEIIEQKFWNLIPNLSNTEYSEQKAKKYAEKYSELLSSAVKLRLRADVKVGSALSGGLDSSSIVYFVNKSLQELNVHDKHETFSNIYTHEKTQHLDESHFIDDITEFLKVKSNKIEPQVADLIHEIPKMIYMMDNPPNGSAMSGWHVFKCVSKTDVKVTLDGHGADEQLSGYIRYIYNYVANLPIKSIIKEYSLIKKIPKINFRELNLAILINILVKILSKKVTRTVFSIFNKNDTILKPLNEVLIEDTMTELITLLHYGDRLSMNYSIESRVPFMDYRLVEFIASIPSVYKMHNGWSKFVARIAMNKILPDKVTWRRDKVGFPNADDFWFRGELKDWICNKIETSEFLKEITNSGDIRKRINSKEPILNFVRLLNLAIWHEIFFEKRNENLVKSN